MTWYNSSRSPLYRVERDICEAWKIRGIHRRTAASCGEPGRAWLASWCARDYTEKLRELFAERRALRS